MIVRFTFIFVQDRPRHKVSSHIGETRVWGACGADKTNTGDKSNHRSWHVGEFFFYRLTGNVFEGKNRGR